MGGQVLTLLANDLLWFGVVFLACWIVYFSLHLAAVSLGLVRGVGKSTVLMALAAAVVTGMVSWHGLGSLFSSTTAHHLVCLVAPFAFVGFCGNYVLVGPVTVDRSITLTILSALADSTPRGLTEAKL